MHIMHASPRFPGQRVVGRGGGPPWRPAIARRRGAAGDDHDPARWVTPTICQAPSCTSPRTCCARKGFTDIRYMYP